VRTDPGHLTAAAYATPTIRERHRHRFEFNNKYSKADEGGPAIAGKNPQRNLVKSWKSRSPVVCGRAVPPEFQSKSPQGAPALPRVVKAAIARRKNRKSGSSAYSSLPEAHPVSLGE
jgi:CTP synthase